MYNTNKETELNHWFPYYDIFPESGILETSGQKYIYSAYYDKNITSQTVLIFATTPRLKINKRKVPERVLSKQRQADVTNLQQQLLFYIWATPTAYP